MKKGLFYICATFILSLAVILYLSYLYFNSFHRSNQYIGKVEHAYRVVLQISELENYLKEAETGQRGYLLTRDSSFLAPFLEVRKHIKPAYDSLKRLTAGNDIQQQYLNNTGLLINRSIDFLQHSIYLANVYNYQLTDRMKESKVMMDSIRTILGQVQREESKMIKGRLPNLALYGTALPTYFGATLLFAFLIFVVSFIVIFREFRRRVRYQKELEQKMKEVNTYNAELEQIAFATSHDLQEPLRRIQTFSDRLISKHANQLSEEGKMIVSRIEYSARRMQGLIEDLMNFTNLVRNGEELEEINADELLATVLDSMQERIREKNAVIHAGQLPVITGYRHQLYLMFRSLIDNALKYSKPRVPPVITIQCVKTTGQELDVPGQKNRQFIRLSIRDNGLGFNNEFNQKIFLIFQRLHSGGEYEGKGIGLAIVERVMTNHNGYVRASGQVNKGAEFNLYFPVSEN